MLLFGSLQFAGVSVFCFQLLILGVSGRCAFVYSLGSLDFSLPNFPQPQAATKYLVITSFLIQTENTNSDPQALCGTKSANSAE